MKGTVVSLELNVVQNVFSIMDDSMENFTNFLEALISSIEELLKSVGEFLTHAKEVSHAFNELNESVDNFFKLK